MKSLNTDIQKSPCQSLIKTSVYFIIKAFISVYDYMAQDLAAKIHQKWPLLDQKTSYLVEVVSTVSSTDELSSEHSLH